MRTFIAILILAEAFFVKPMAQAAGKSLELILIDDNVVFTTATNISVEMVFRNVGEANMSPVGLLKGLSVVWDGKDCMRDPDPKRGPSYNILLDFQPKHGWRRRLSLSDYLIPAERLTPGRHTLALREGTSKSNSLTIFIETPQ
jgi:hypothetical protein